MRTKLLMLLALLGVIVAFSGSLQADAVVYEPFNYEVGGLDGQGDPNQVGLEGTWNAQESALLIADSLTYGTLPTTGGSIGGLAGGSNHYGGARAISVDALAGNGLLDDGATLWFSVEMGFGTGGNTANARLAFALANDQFNEGNYNYWINDDGEQLGSGIGVILGRLDTIIGSVAAAQFRDSASGDALAGNILGNTTDALYGEGEHGLIVGKIMWGSENDTIEIYQPDMDMNLGDPISTLTTTVDQSTFDTITWARGDSVAMDEIRFGENYAAVLGERGPTGLYPIDGSTVPTGDVELSWTNIAAADPNGSTFVDVWFGVDPENMSQLVDADADGQDVESYLLEDLAAGVYFWRVDTYVDGSELINEDNKIAGVLFTFSNDYAPVPDVGSDMATWSGQGVEMVLDAGDDGASPLTYQWTAEAPAGIIVEFDPADADVENPTVTITKPVWTSIQVPNGSFEKREDFDPFTESTDRYFQYALENWRQFDVTINGGPVRVWNPGNPAVPEQITEQGVLDVGFAGQAPDGKYVAAVRTRYNDDVVEGQVRDFEATVQLLPDMFNPDAAYKLTVQVGRPIGSINYEPNYHGYAVQLAVGGENIGSNPYAGSVSGGTVIAEDYSSLIVPTDGFVTSTVEYVSGSASSDLAGLPLQIRLCALENPADHSQDSFVVFDNVELVSDHPDDVAVVTLTIAVNDENNPISAEDSMTIYVYDTACQATRDGGNLGVNNPTDLDGDCVTTLKDFAEMAAKWMIDTLSTGPVDLE